MLAMKYLICLLIFSMKLLAQGQMNSPLPAERFYNDREGSSPFIQKKERSLIAEWEDKVSIDQTKEIFQHALSRYNPSNICAYNLMTDLMALSSQYGKPKSFLLALRKNDVIDDIVLATLLKNFHVLNSKITFKYELTMKLGEEEQKVFKEYFPSNPKLNTRCIDESYKVWKAKMNISDRSVRADSIQVAYQENIINYQVFQKLYRTNLANIDKDYVTLRDYLSKKQELRDQKPILPSERTTLIAQKVKGKNSSYRSQLYQRYDVVQIMFLADIINKLQEHLASTKMILQIYNKDETLLRSIELEEMERFRFALKFLRKEMLELSNNAYFFGQSISYMDLISAAFEVGLISTKDIDEVAKLETLWNPRKTLYEKAAVWIRLAGSVGTLLIPPPYGFAVALGLVAIESSAKKSQKIVSPDYSLF